MLAIFSPPVVRTLSPLQRGKLRANCVATCVVMKAWVKPFFS